MSKRTKAPPPPILSAEVQAVFDALPKWNGKNNVWTPEEDVALLKYVNHRSCTQLAASWEKAFGHGRSRSSLTERFKKLTGQEKIYE